ncbi:hypothetical protein [Micromonospora sp. WMMA2032]|nr:hypothetical protein [Micromonospora sp. WMMA2032]
MSDPDHAFDGRFTRQCKEVTEVAPGRLGQCGKPREAHGSERPKGK